MLFVAWYIMSQKKQRGKGILTNSKDYSTSLFTDSGDDNLIKQIYYILGNMYGIFYVDLKDMHNVVQIQ